MHRALGIAPTLPLNAQRSECPAAKIASTLGSSMEPCAWLLHFAFIAYSLQTNISSDSHANALHYIVGYFSMLWGYVGTRLDKDAVLRVASPFFPGILLFEKPSTHPGKRPVSQENDGCKEWGVNH